MRGVILLFAVATALTLVMAVPVLEAPADRLFGREIVGRHHDAYTVAAQFERPSRQPFSQPATDLVGAALARWTGGVAAVNVLVLASFPLAALFAFLLARQLALPALAAALAALAFAFSPAHVAHAAYHPHVAQIQWLPLYLLALVRCLDRWTAGRAALLLLAGGLVALSNFYFGLFVALLTPLAVWLYRGQSPGAAPPARGRTILTLAGGGVAGAAYLRWSAGPLGELAARYAFPPGDLERYSARWYSYLLPPVDHPLVGARVRDFWRDQAVGDGLLEQQLTLGLGLLALAGVALALWWRRPASVPAARAVPLLAVLAAAAWLGSLAPGGGGPWPAPALPAMIHPILPMFRAYARLGFVVQLAVALLAAAGLAALAARGRRARWVAVALVGLAVVELAPVPPWRWHHVLPTRGHRWMAAQPPPWRLLDCANEPPAVASSIARLMPQPATLLSPDLPDCAEPGLPGKLAARGFSHLLLRAGAADERWHAVNGLPEGLAEERRFSDARLLRVTAQPAALTVDGWLGFSWREYGKDGTWRWLGAGGEWQLALRGEAPSTGRLELELWALGGARVLDLLLDGALVASPRIAEEPGWYVLGPLTLAPGAHRLAWRPSGPPLVPDELLGNGDRRRLTVAVGAWRWRPETVAAPF